MTEVAGAPPGGDGQDAAGEPEQEQELLEFARRQKREVNARHRARKKVRQGWCAAVPAGLCP